MRLYYEIARKAFQRGATYRLATFTGIIVNAFFGYIQCYIFLAAYQAVQGQPTAGFAVSQIISYTWLSQSLITVVNIWFDKAISKTIESGDVVSDFSKPFDYQAFQLSRFLGNSFFSLLFRSIPTYAIGMLFFGAQLPPNLFSLPFFGLSLLLSTVVSFLTCYMVNLTAFWTLSTTGMFAIMATLQMFFSGFIVPLAYMPDWLATLANFLPFQAIITAPAQLWLGQKSGWEVLLPQVLWLILLWLLARRLTSLAMRRVTIQGG